MKKTLGKIFIVLLAAALLAAVVCIAFAARPDLKYIVSSKAGMLGGGEKPQKTVVDKVRGYTLDELNAVENVAFDESLRLINEQYPCSGEAFDIREYKDTGVYMNACALDGYARLSREVSARFSQTLFVSSAYRSAQEQADIHQQDSRGLSVIPGASEHEAGLGIDVFVSNYAGYGFLKSDVGQFVDSQAWRCGFIIRYPLGKKDRTGVKYEPWHIRYVGEPHAQIIHENWLCLEEYFGLFEPGKFYSYGEYVIRLEESGSFLLPEQFESAVISEVCEGKYMVTVRPHGAA